MYYRIAGWIAICLPASSLMAARPYLVELVWNGSDPSMESSAPEAGRKVDLVWHSDYGAACATARAEHRMLLINFVPGGENQSNRLVAIQAEFDREIAARPGWREKLGQYVLVRLPQDAEILTGGTPIRLLRHGAFAEMHEYPGIAIIDFANLNTSYYGHVVSAFPFMSSKYYHWRISFLPAILDLPPGTITQRTMVWAVRVHPERPASTSGVMDIRLARAARRHSEYQARLGLQGHHRWEGRFHRLRALLGGGMPVEIVAESWPGQNMIDSCLDCVASWRYSSGHWNAVQNSHALYGYDIHRGTNGIWYGTGIFASY
ncbi:MAG: hypothetical protein JW829_19315 [Pirellulales bacterium]|nr:hypothetical protein [Pirellulales bacterium]